MTPFASLIYSIYQIDTVSEVLQQRCGSFCSADDVMLYKVSLGNLSFFVANC